MPGTLEVIWFDPAAGGAKKTFTLGAGEPVFQPLTLYCVADEAAARASAQYTLDQMIAVAATDP